MSFFVEPIYCLTFRHRGLLTKVGETLFSRRQFLKICVSSVAALSLGSIAEQWIGQSKTIIALPALRVPILVYHRVGPTYEPLTVSNDQFTRDLQQLKEHNFTTISLADLDSFLHGRGPVNIPHKSVLITFDDGYIDNYVNAFPILRQFDMVATFYTISGMIGQDNRLSAKHIKEMKAAGMDFGSHTVSHRALGKLDQQAARDELYFSKQRLEDLLETEITSIAYPTGSYNEETLRIVKGLNYSLAFTVNQGICSPSSEKLILPRIPVFSYTRDIISEINKLQ
jgi:peptidoglycan/xylan/chitin deacetylase (PgdA/CDA1 family)